MKSIFSIRTKADEPYLTQVLSYVLDSDRRFCAFVLSEVFKLPAVERIVGVFPEQREAGDQPDIRIDCQAGNRLFRVAVENRIDAPFQLDQIPRYHDKFDHVVVLYNRLADPERGRMAHSLCSWATFCLRAREYLSGLDNNYNVVHRFQIEEFVCYLEEKGMGIGRVTWEIENGMRALMNLFDQVDEALGRLLEEGILSKKASAGAATRNYYGWKAIVDDDEFYVYVIYSPPAVTAFFSDREKDWSQHFKPMGDVHPDLWGNGLYHIGTLPVGEGHFLCLAVDEQIEAMEDFVRRAKETWENA